MSSSSLSSLFSSRVVRAGGGIGSGVGTSRNINESVNGSINISGNGTSGNGLNSSIRNSSFVNRLLSISTPNSSKHQQQQHQNGNTTKSSSASSNHSMYNYLFHFTTNYRKNLNTNKKQHFLQRNSETKSNTITNHQQLGNKTFSIFNLSNNNNQTKISPWSDSNNGEINSNLSSPPFISNPASTKNTNNTNTNNANNNNNVLNLITISPLPLPTLLSHPINSVKPQDNEE